MKTNLMLALVMLFLGSVNANAGGVHCRECPAEGDGCLPRRDCPTLVSSSGMPFPGQPVGLEAGVNCTWSPEPDQTVTIAIGLPAPSNAAASQPFSASLTQTRGLTTGVPQVIADGIKGQFNFSKESNQYYFDVDNQNVFSFIQAGLIFEGKRNHLGQLAAEIYKGRNKYNALCTTWVH